MLWRRLLEGYYVGIVIQCWQSDGGIVQYLSIVYTISPVSTQLERQDAEQFHSNPKTKTSEGKAAAVGSVCLY